MNQHERRSILSELKIQLEDAALNHIHATLRHDAEKEAGMYKDWRAEYNGYMEIVWYPANVVGELRREMQLVWTEWYEKHPSDNDTKTAMQRILERLLRSAVEDKRWLLSQYENDRALYQHERMLAAKQTAALTAEIANFEAQLAALVKDI
jgi:hypothetical protein